MKLGRPRIRTAKERQEQKNAWGRKNQVRLRPQKLKWQKEAYRKYPWYRWYIYLNSRCGDKNRNYYKRGIKNLLKVNDIKYLWFRDKAYLLKRPSIDRKNNNGNYTLTNCRFIELSENIKRYYREGGKGRW